MLQSQRFYHKDCWSNQGRSQDFNGALQDIAQNFDDDVIIKTLTSLSWNMFISLNMVHLGWRCGVLGFTAPLILTSK